MATLTPTRPPRLHPGARVALIAPAGPVDDARIERALASCARLELQAVLAASARSRVDYLAGDDAARAADLAWALTDASVDAVWALRGGYGAMRTLAALGGLPPHSPRPYIGFSDNTAVHLALLRGGRVSFHGPHAGGELPHFAEAVFRRVLFEPEPAGVLPLPAGAPAPMALVGGRADGELVGGNLSLLSSLIGTPWQLDARGRILFIEEVGESFYRLDRMLTHLRLAGALDGVAAVVLGQFTECAGDDCERSLDALLLELLAPLGVPVGYGYPFGHVGENWTLPLGVRARFDADAGVLELLEPAVA